MQLRPYQKDLLSRVEGEFESNHAVMMQLVTGGGKTAIAAEWAKKFNSVLFICHTLSVIGQAPDEFAKWDVRCEPAGTGINSWDAAYGATQMFGGVLAATAGTASSRILLESGRISRRTGRFDALVIDEAHHAYDGRTRVNSLVNGAKRVGIPILGMTATPWRLSKRQGFLETWDTMVCGPTWLDLRGRYLSDVVMRTTNDAIVGAGAYGSQDYKEGATQKINQDNPVFREGAFDVLEQFGGGKTIMYAVGQQHALRLADIAKSQNIPTGLLVSSNSVRLRAPEGVEVDPAKVRDGLRSGKIRLVINVNMITEGYDCPDVETVMCLRPTKSLSLWLQMCGRGSRLADDKPFLRLIDLTDNHKRLGPPLHEHTWSLAPREEDEDFGDAIMRYCSPDPTGAASNGCGLMIYTAYHSCPQCGESQGKTCEECGKFRLWERYNTQDDGTMNARCFHCREADEISKEISTKEPDEIAPRDIEEEAWYYPEMLYPKSNRWGNRYYVIFTNGVYATATKKYQRDAWEVLDEAWDSGDNVQVQLKRNGQWVNVVDAVLC